MTSNEIIHSILKAFDDPKVAKLVKRCSIHHEIEYLNSLEDFASLDEKSRQNTNLFILKNCQKYNWKMAAFYSRESGDHIVFCQDNLKNLYEERTKTLTKLLRHELVHFYDHKIGNINLDSTDGLLKSELRAYDYSEMCDFSERFPLFIHKPGFPFSGMLSKTECLKNRAWTSYQLAVNGKLDKINATTAHQKMDNFLANSDLLTV